MLKKIFLLCFVSFFSLHAMEKKEGMEIAISKYTLPIAQDVETNIDPICRDDLGKAQWPELFTVHTVNGIPHTFHAECLNDWVIKNNQLNCPTCRFPISSAQAVRIHLTQKLPKSIGKFSDSEKLEFREYIQEKSKKTIILREDLSNKLIKMQQTLELQNGKLESQLMLLVQQAECVEIIKNKIKGAENKIKEQKRIIKILGFSSACNVIYWGCRGYEYFYGKK
ncbi:E3 ubiquitin protein ligase [Candidatus Dependentiae bacterium]|nr:E3 ubiquitin protein ligase [Candidatus Dependentiae bacterium]